MFEFKLPDLGEGVHEGQIVNVLVKEGDSIQEFAPMLEVETDKAAVEIPSPRSGRVAKVNCAAGQKVHVGDVLVVIDDGSGAASGGERRAAAPAAASARSAATTAPAAAAPAPAAPRSAAPAATNGQAGGLFEFKLPDLGEGVHEGQIVNVLIQPGQMIQEFQPMLEVETDKAAVEIPSPRAGRVARVNAAPGQKVRVGEVLVVIEESGGPAAPAARSAAPAAPAAAPAIAPAHVPAAAVSAGARASVAAPPPVAGGGIAARVHRDGPAPAAPVVRKLARELGIDINAVPGSGSNGRILREDVERFALQQRGGGAPARAPAAGAAASGGGMVIAAEALPDFSQYGPVRRVAAPQIRKTIARQMSRAWLNVPRVTHGDEADITELERNRKQLNEALRDGQPKMTVTAIVMKAVAQALRTYPQLNCSWDATTEEIVFKDYIHIGVAVDTPRGLVVPVVRDVDKKPLPQIAAELNAVAERTRTGKFEIADLRGATFTITNVGALGGTFSTAMVNYPEVAILALARSVWAPRVLMPDKQIVPRLILPVSLSFDHRVIDGADSARFTRDVVGALENPLRLIMG